MIRSTERLSFDRITDHVYIGAQVVSDDGLHRLRAHGIQACVDMRAETSGPPRFDCVLWLPTTDHEPPSRRHLHLGIVFLRRCEADRVPVMVACAMGVGRSTSLVLAYLLAGEFRDAGIGAALDHIASRRPIVNPNREQCRAAEDAARSFIP